MIKGLHPFPQRPSEIQENWRATREALEHVYFRKWLIGATGIGLGGSAEALVANATQPLPGVQFPNAATSSWRWTIPLDPLVGPAIARVTFWFSSPVGSTNTFSITCAVRSYDTTGTSALIGTSTANYAGPAVADTWQQGGPIVLSALPFLAGRHLSLRATIQRNDPDANANTLDFIQALLEILPQP